MIGRIQTAARSLVCVGMLTVVAVALAYVPLGDLAIPQHRPMGGIASVMSMADTGPRHGHTPDDSEGGSGSRVPVPCVAMCALAVIFAVRGIAGDAGPGRRAVPPPPEPEVRMAGGPEPPVPRSWA